MADFVTKQTGALLTTSASTSAAATAKLRAAALASTLALFGLVLTSPSSAAVLPARHLYVADDGNNQIVEFPIRADGLPSKKPDNVLKLDGPPYGLALDSAENLYVSVEAPANNGNVIEVFAHGASGSQKPERVVSFGVNTFPLYLAIDNAQNLYVDLGNFDIGIYNLAKSKNPIANIPIPDVILDMKLDRSGELYVSEENQVGVYLQPLLRQQPDGLVFPQGGFEYAIIGSIAIDDNAGKLYFQTAPFVNQRWGEFDFAVRKLPGYGNQNRGNADPLILSDACDGPDQRAISYGAAISGRYLLAGCVGSTPVFAFDKDRFGRRSPVEAIGSGYVQGESDIIVGP